MSVSFQLVHAKPNRVTTIALSWFLFAAGVGLYFYVAQKRHQENPEDRIMPTVTQMFHGMANAGTNPAEDDELLPTMPRCASDFSPACCGKIRLRLRGDSSIRSCC
jgi:disulfide bond formation protein DsbB